MLGKAFGKLLSKGSVVALCGNLASGKTCFVHGVAQAFGIQESVSSPTFTLINEYQGDRKVYHLDLYRINHTAELFDLGYEDLFSPGDAISLIEWAERADRVLPPRHLSVHFEHAGDDKRSIVISDNGVLPTGWQETLKAAVAA